MQLLLSLHTSNNLKAELFEIISLKKCNDSKVCESKV